MYNKLLDNQIQKHFGTIDQVPENYLALFADISKSYDDHENDIDTAESPVTRPSNVLIELNNRLSRENDDLYKTNKELKNVLENIEEILYSVDMVSLKILHISAACEKVYGYTQAEFLTDRDLWQNVVFPEDIDMVHNHFTELYMGKQITGQYRILHKDGSMRWLESKIIPSLDESGQLIRLDGVTNDISGRKRAEDKIKESELRYRTLIEQATDAICIADATLKFTDMNPYACEVLGYTKEEALQLSMMEVLFEEDLETNPFKFDRVKSNGVIRNERRLKRKDGTTIVMELSTTLMEGGGFIVFGHDISERKRSEEVLRESEKHLRQIIDLVPHFIFAKDAGGKFVLANEAVANAYGFKAEDLIGKSDADFNPHDEEVEHFRQEDIKAILSGNIKYNIEETITDADGKIRVLSTTKIPYTSAGLDTPGVLGVSVDISEHKNAERVLKESEGQLTVAAQIAKLGYWEFDVALNQFKFNDQFYSIFKTTAEEMGGYTMSSELYAELFVHPDDLLLVTRAAAEAIKSPSPNYSNQIEHRIKYANGGIGYMASRFFSAKDISGRTVKIVGAIQDISERKNAETILKQSEGRLAIAAGIAKLGYWEYDVLSDLFTFNDQFYAIFRTTTLQVGGTRLSAARYAELFVHPDDQHVVSGEVGEAISSPDPHFSHQIEHRIIYSDGEIGYVSVHFYVVKDDNGRTIKTFGVNQDITERKKTEEALSNNELRFRTLAGSAPVGIFQTNTEGKTIYVNERFLEYTGLTFEESMGDSWMQAIHPADRAMVLKGWDESLKQETDPSAEYRLLDKKGNIKWVIGQAVRIFNKSGLRSGYIGTMSDITERKLAIESLQQSETKYRKIVETAQEGIWLIDEKDNTTFVNKKMCEIVGYAAEELMGEKIYHFMGDESRKKAFQQIERRKQGLSEIHDSLFVSKDGKDVWVNISTNPVTDDKGIYKGALAMITDISLRKQQEELLRISEANLALKNKELEHTNKELEHFAYIASHDLQEPLRTTSSFVKLLQQQYKGKMDEKADKYLHYIVDSSDRMKVLITDLLDYSRIGSKRELQLVDCNTMLNELMQDLGAVLKETGAKMCVDRLPVISGYKTEIKQLFQNLIVNAIKFRKKDTTPQVSIWAVKDHTHWTFVVRDNGIGIEKDHTDRIFVIFQRLHTRNEYEGSGIGLAHCKKIVDLHGGKIWVESIPGEGATFHFNIPLINT
ncbi:MAG: PAS domain S-box protein [Chitinophagaceae bacterium]